MCETQRAAHKRCPGCCAVGEYLPRSAFPPNRARDDGLGAYCRSCQGDHGRASYRKTGARESTRVRLRDHRAELRALVWEYLRSHPCVDCGERDPVVLEFDHREHKRAAVSNLVQDRRAWSVIEEEIGRCDVRCANCHRRRHYQQRTLA